MKKNIIAFSFFSLIISSCASNATADGDVLKSTDITKIEEYLAQAHPQDPKKGILRQRIIALKNAEWTKGAKNAKPMEARPVFMELPNLSIKKKNSDANQEIFKNLMAETSDEHKEKTTKLLNNMFNEDINHNEAIVLLKNNSDCNLVLEISGKKFYNLAVPAKGENFIVLNKDSYIFSGSVCDVKYKNPKDITKSMVIVLQNPGLPSIDTKELLAQNSNEKQAKNIRAKPKSTVKKKKKK